VPRLEKRTHYIATFANVITLVGLLGTIIGLIKGFTAVAQVNPAELEAANISFLNLVQRLRAESAAAQPAR
jgi:biopolymer transport protein ExbB/TolQ